MLCSYFRARLSCQPRELKGTHPFHFSDRHLLRDKLISFWDVLHYCSPTKAFYLEQNKSDEKKNKIRTLGVCLFINGYHASFFWRYLDLFDHAGRQRWAADRSYCRSINQWFLQSWALSSAQHQLWCAVTAASAAVTLNTSAVQVAAGWTWLTATKHYILQTTLSHLTKG